MTRASRVLRIVLGLSFLGVLAIAGANGRRSMPTVVPSTPPPVPAPDAGPRDEGCPELGPGVDPWADKLGAHTLEDRGAIVSCAHVARATWADVARSPLSLPAMGPPTDGYDLFVIQYVSEGRPRLPRTATALLYVPNGGRSRVLADQASPGTRRSGVPVVAFGHAVSGMGPSCGATHLRGLIDAFALPLVGRGYAVVAPDYAGMGVDNGMTSYLIGASEAAATLDALRAVRGLRDPRFDPALLGDEAFIAGYSQGGHAALFAHQHFDPGVGMRLLGSIALAPGLGSARSWAQFFKDPARRVGTMETYALMMLYAHMLHAGAPEPGSWLTPRAAALLPTMLHDHCAQDLVTTVSTAFPTLGDLYLPEFLAASRCAFGKKCPGFAPWASILAAEQPGDFASDVPSLVLQGLADTVVAPATAACIVERMRARGTAVQACGYPGGDHFTFLLGAVPDMIRWIAGRRAGMTPDVCQRPLAASCGSGRDREP